MDLIQAIILGIIEGLTEFLPVSSTGHMILAGSLMEIKDKDFENTFEIGIQIGAILSVLVIYYKRFFVSIDIYLKLFIAFIPTAIIGLLAYKFIKAYLFNSIVVSIALIAGGILLVLLDKWSDKEESLYTDTDAVSYKGAVQIGFFQCLAMIPGVSRSAATIFGGVSAGFNRKQAAEFSFLLAIPTMFAATGYDLFKTGFQMTSHQWNLMFVGAAVAFVCAIIAVKAFVALLTKYGFKHFGYYRIVIGIVFLVFAIYTGIKL
ncbi:MAG: undecaprenyl-diphosphate phosphatase [Bacteroidetes bacterium]|nr:undecaprenyl-diphosphate phosphatase [Bacteroidota bacterium]HET6243277.1 undecaprenyl-diphosphate phosphatase [Bacteroidia bacterium]